MAASRFRTAIRGQATLPLEEHSSLSLIKKPIDKVKAYPVPELPPNCQHIDKMLQRLKAPLSPAH